jgi:catechol O-methyltransferase
MKDPNQWHFTKNLFLLALSLFFLPIDTAIVAAFSILNRVRPSRHEDDVPPPPSQKKTILVTGMSMSKGLVLARLFHRRGHRVIGADVHPLAMGRISSSLDKFYVLPAVSQSDKDTTSPMEEEIENEVDDEYVLKLLSIVKKEDVDLWVSVSDVNAALKDAVARDVIETHTKAKAVQFGVKDVRNLDEKDAFIEHTRYLGLPVPDSQVVTSREAIIEFLNKRGGLKLKPDGRGTQYILKPIGVDDFLRNEQVLLPLATEQETLRRLDAIPAFQQQQQQKSSAAATFPHEKPSFILQEFIRGREFCTHALVVKGRIRAFTACPSASVLMHYTALPEDSPLCRAMLAFTRIMAGAGGAEWTGHVSYDFLVKPRRSVGQSANSSPAAAGGEKDKGEDVWIYPIECNPRVHTAVVLFSDTPDVVDEYLAILDGDAEQRSLRRRRSTSSNDPVYPKSPSKHYYWIGQDLVERVIYPLSLFLFASGTLTPSQLWESVWEFCQHLRYWKDGTFEAWDPWPWWWLYHVYWPTRFAGFLVRGRWNMINVSTGKAFKAR